MKWGLHVLEDVTSSLGGGRSRGGSFGILHKKTVKTSNSYVFGDFVRVGELQP